MKNLRVRLPWVILTAAVLVAGCGGGTTSSSGDSGASNPAPGAPSPSPATYTLATTVSGSGTVASNPAGVTCGTDCTESYTDGTSVTLTATPATGNTFLGWSGACSGTGSCVVTMSQARSVTATFTTTTTTSPYPWYPSLDLNTIPFHAGAGPWGPQQTIQAPAAPVITREVTATSASQMATELQVPGTRVIVDFDTALSDNVNVFGTIIDAELVIPAGRTIGQTVFGHSLNNREVRRFRIRGNTLGQYSGGLVGNILFLGVVLEDIHIDGIGVSGPGNTTAGGSIHPHGTTRMAVTNNRLTSPEMVFLGSVSHLVVAGNTASGGRDRFAESPGKDESWVFRNSNAPAVYYDNYLKTTLFHIIRQHGRAADADPQYVWASGNTLVHLNEARIFDAFYAGTTNKIDAAWFTDNQVYGVTTGMTPSMQARAVNNYVRVTNNTTYGDFTLAIQQGANTISEATDKDHTTGNIYNSAATPPAWNRAGDPEVLPIP